MFTESQRLSASVKHLRLKTIESSLETQFQTQIPAAPLCVDVKLGKKEHEFT